MRLGRSGLLAVRLAIVTSQRSDRYVTEVFGLARLDAQSEGDRAGDPLIAQCGQTHRWPDIELIAKVPPGGMPLLPSTVGLTPDEVYRKLTGS